ncbi:hypothetical protein GUJ93_ZPchr0007g5858 [Zizania palustris]|uniref:Uncharacterized protein n=1 Tax=Zizania palustris TaxID=103762 RepID=A0A8J5T392_ZIZPA|nr:hypothetical protein GUJ93_ZPchr0007g5858 [Zizania palustris]
MVCIFINLHYECFFRYYTILQDDIINFRFKLPSILWESKLNTYKGQQQTESKIEDIEGPSDVEIIETPFKSAKLSYVSNTKKEQQDTEQKNEDTEDPAKVDPKVVIIEEQKNEDTEGTTKVDPKVDIIETSFKVPKLSYASNEFKLDVSPCVFSKKRRIISSATEELVRALRTYIMSIENKNLQ